MRLSLVVLLALLGILVPAQAQAAPTAHTVTYDKYSVQIDGQPTYIWSAEFHYFRLPSPDQWKDVLQKVKAAGFNAVSLYFAWGYHSPKQGVYDFTGIRDVERLLRTAEEAGLYVIARPGPYINAEISLGGFPAWLKTRTGVNRTSEPEYLAAAREWLSQINPILARHLYTRGTGSVILYQIENEYQGGRQDADYMQSLIDWARADGIDVPTFVNDGGANRNWVTGKGAPDIYGFDAYPQGFDCKNPTQWRDLPDYSYVRQWKPEVPLFMPEAQGGAFDGWGGTGFDNCRQLTGPDFTRVFSKMSLAAGVSLQNFYMTFGGTNFGWLADPRAGYTSYDYGAPINESRQLTAKYTEFKRLGYLLESVRPLARTNPELAPPVGDTALRVDRRVNPDNGTQFFFLRHNDTRETATHETTLRIGDHTTGPVRIAGRDAKLLVADYDLGAQRLVYSTSEILTHATIGPRDVAILYGRSGEAGETVLRYANQPRVKVLAGQVQSIWNNGELKLTYQHNGLARVLIEGGTRPFELLLGTDEEAGQWWRQDTEAGPILVRGPYLVRDASVFGPILSLTGDTERAGDLEVIAPPSVKVVRWNGRVTTGELATTPQPVRLPALTDWRYQAGTPEAAVDFDDSTWTAATKVTANHPSLAGSIPVLAADEYGYHHGDVWYRGRYRSNGTESTIVLNTITGPNGVYAAWLNGQYLGSSGEGRHEFTIPPGTARDGDNVLAVLVENMGHNEEWGHDYSKEPRGLLSGALIGAGTTITWKIQGNRGGEDLFDPARGPFNAGGLYGERAGFTLPGFPDTSWPKAQLPERQPAGVHWYRTNVRLDLPRNQDNAIGLKLTDDTARQYRVHLYVNGWLAGRYLNNVGPQHTFVLPAGILHEHGDNTIALAVWSIDGSGPPAPQLVDLGAHAGGLPVQDVPAPNWDPKYNVPTSNARLSVDASPFITGPTTVTVKLAAPGAQDVKLSLAVPEGWQSVRSGADTWQVTPAGGTPYAVLTAQADFRQQGVARTLREPRAVQVPPPGPLGTRYVSDLTLVRSSNGWGPVELDMSNGEGAAGDGRPISIGDVRYPKGLGVHPAGDVRVYLGGACRTFTATVGVDDEVGDTGSVVFSVLADERSVHTSPVLRGSDGGQQISLDVRGVYWLDLVTSDAGDNPWSDHADWADAKVDCSKE